MSTFEATVSMLEGLTDDQLQYVQDLARRFMVQPKVTNPYKSLSKEEILSKLDLSKQHSDKGMVRDADEVIQNIGARYGL